MCAADRLHSRFGKSEVLDLAFPDQVLHRSRDVFDRHIRVDTVLVEEIDEVGLQSLERALDALLDVLGPTVRHLLPVVDPEPELGGDDHLTAKGGKGFADELFVREGTVDLGGVEKCDAPFDGTPYKGNHLLLVTSRTVAIAHSHTAEPDRRDFQIALSKFALLHCFSFEVSSVGSPHLQKAFAPLFGA